MAEIKKSNLQEIILIKTDTLRKGKEEWIQSQQLLRYRETAMN